MRITKNRLRRSLRKVLRESVHSHLDGELTNVIFAACQEVAEEYGDITVEDVLNHLASVNDDYLTTEVAPEHRDYFAQAVRDMTYDDAVDRMFQLVSLGELTGGYEDFFELAR